MKQKFKAAWKKVQTVFRNPIYRLFIGTILLIFAVLIKADIITAYLGQYVSLVLGLVWIVFALFYFTMYLWAIITK